MLNWTTKLINNKDFFAKNSVKKKRNHFPGFHIFFWLGLNRNYSYLIITKKSRYKVKLQKVTIIDHKHKIDKIYRVEWHKIHLCIAVRGRSRLMNKWTQISWVCNSSDPMHTLLPIKLIFKTVLKLLFKFHSLL